MQKFEKLRTAISKNIISMTNFTNTTHFTPANVLERHDHCFQKGSGNHYLIRIISATPFISTKFSTVPLIQNVTMCNISKYIGLKESIFGNVAIVTFCVSGTVECYSIIQAHS